MTIPGDVYDRLAAVEADNARLRRRLDEVGVSDHLRHALRDTVALLRAVMRRSAETASDVESYVAHLEGRLDSLMRMRARTDAFGEADLHLLVSEELMFHLVREGERAFIEGPALRLRPGAAQVLALAIHELASNAVEHGALDEASGTVDVCWQIEKGNAAPVLVLVWTERGGHIDSEAPVRRGFGREVLETMLAYELGARTEMAFDPTGLRFTLRLPFTQRIGRYATEEASVAAEDVSEPNAGLIGER
ncbi:HWE histidine kinase domain-containing protein [Methylobacterium sp. NFXW15]|uniref:HWE histidine kinase domain-containing protein n=1 Tax=Methylobacterium sp. NFXW15 TaxID=2819512 RepID=UPI003CEA1214